MNIDSLIKEQLTERYKSIILCGAGMTGKTTLAKKIAVEFAGCYIDILKEISEDSVMCNQINAVKPEQIYRMIDKNKEIIVVADHLDIVFSLWTETQQKEFLRKLDMKSNGSCWMIVLHNYKLLEQEGILRKNSLGKSRIVNIATVS